MKVLVTGSEGNVGKVLVPYLRKSGHVVFRCDQVQGFAKDYLVVNILSSGDLHKAFAYFCPEVVFHLAAMVSRVASEASPNLTIDTNLSGLNNVIQLCKLFNSKLIFISTSEVYGNIGGLLSEGRECRPNNLYGLSKYLGEQLVRYELNNGLHAIIVRPFMFYREGELKGENHSALIRFTDALLNKQKVTVHIGATRSWLHLNDGVIILEKLLSETGFYTINIGSHEQITIKRLAEIICEKLNLNYDDYVIEEPLPNGMTLEKRPSLIQQRFLTGDMQFISIEEGIERVIKSMVNAHTTD